MLDQENNFKLIFSPSILINSLLYGVWILKGEVKYNHFWKLKVKDAYFIPFNINPLGPTSYQDRISPYTIGMIPSRQVMRIKKNIN